MSDSLLRLALDSRRAKRQGRDGLEQRRKSRLIELVAHVRQHSPYYRELYKDVPLSVTSATQLPITRKSDLMARFDDWATDREITIAKARLFADDPARVGERFLGKYTLATTSGTTGTRGIFVLDDRTMKVTNAMALRMLTSWLSAGDVGKILARGRRLAMINALGGHFASAVAVARFRGRRSVRAFPVDMPRSQMVEHLNDFQPAVVAVYAGTAAALASEQKAGRLRIRPVLVVLSAEGLPLPEYKRIADTLQARVRHSYAATECPFLSYSCEHDWLHVNADWLELEPVDADYQPTPAGQQSHTVLITNLANRVQPILRYDLGDRILLKPNPCECGDPLPAIRVQGRTADVLSFTAPDGGTTQIAPLLLITLVDRLPGIELIQVLQTSPTCLRIRFRVGAKANADVLWQEIYGQMTRLLAQHQLAHVEVQRASEPPEQSAGGKYREVIPLKPTLTGGET